MAKKTVATLQSSSKRLTKAIKMVKSPKTGAYTFVESVYGTRNGQRLVEQTIRIDLHKILKATF